MCAPEFARCCCGQVATIFPKKGTWYYYMFEPACSIKCALDIATKTAPRMDVLRFFALLRQHNGN